MECTRMIGDHTITEVTKEEQMLLVWSLVVCLCIDSLCRS